MTDDVELVSLTRPSTDDTELQAVADALSSGWLAGHCLHGALLKREVASLTGRKHAVAVNNARPAFISR